MKNGPSARQRSLTAGVQQHDFGLEALSQDVMQIPFGINERSEARGPDHHHTSQLAVLFFCFLDPYPGQASPGREKLNQASAGCYRSDLPVPDAPADVVEGENEEERHRYFYRDEHGLFVLYPVPVVQNILRKNACHKRQGQRDPSAQRHHPDVVQDMCSAFYEALQLSEPSMYQRMTPFSTRTQVIGLVYPSKTCLGA